MAQHPQAFSPSRPQSSRTFILPSSSSSSDHGDDDDDDAPLPFPTALPRSDFLAPDFDAATYLSSLAHRHQTLEDLRSDLRERSAAISSELLELVNANYTSFLSLGDELKGGEERVEDVRVALLGFRRAVEEIKGRVRDKGSEVAGLNRELGGVRGDIETGRKMLELDERISGLEERLAIGSTGPGSDESEEDDEDDDELPDGMVGSSAAKLTRLANDYVAVDELADDIGRETPFVRKMEERLIRCRNTILLDLSTALKEAKKAGIQGQTKLLKLMGIYAVMDAQSEAVKTLKSIR
ncbi:COG complex component, COG2-domain-containing protein [Biscogniauxia sp. FL1348]|nr:COG complex component, COG2-domain-containing protein [Biscogniauxia sp. FL1348]